MTPKIKSEPHVQLREPVSYREKLPSQVWGNVYPNITCCGPGVGTVLDPAMQTEDLAKRELAPPRETSINSIGEQVLQRAGDGTC